VRTVRPPWTGPRAVLFVCCSEHVATNRRQDRHPCAVREPPIHPSMLRIHRSRHGRGGARIYARVHTSVRHGMLPVCSFQLGTDSRCRSGWGEPRLSVCVCVLARHRDDAAFRCIRRLGYHLQGVAETLPALHTQMNSTGSMHATAITGNGRWDSGCSVWGRSKRCGCDCLRNFFVRPPRVGLGDLPQSTDCQKGEVCFFV
jgi:hypothetical protein